MKLVIETELGNVVLYKHKKEYVFYLPQGVSGERLERIKDSNSKLIKRFKNENN